MTKLSQIWVEECDVAVSIEAEFDTEKALDYLIGEKFMDFLNAAGSDPDFRAEIPAFVAEIKTIFERWQLAEYLERASQMEPLDSCVYAIRKSAKFENQFDNRQGTVRLSLVERATEWLLGEGE